jgi:hypothetical protein
MTECGEDDGLAIPVVELPMQVRCALIADRGLPVVA